MKRRNRKAVLLSGCPLSLRIEQDLLPYSIGRGMRVNKELDREGLGATFPSGIPTRLSEVSFLLKLSSVSARASAMRRILVLILLPLP